MGKKSDLLWNDKPLIDNLSYCSKFIQKLISNGSY